MSILQKRVQKKMRNISETLIINFDHCNDDIPVLLISKCEGKQVNVLSTFLGSEAYEIYSKLIGVERK